jgi:hypothetical protein
MRQPIGVRRAWKPWLSRKPNARPELLPEAGARHERTLEAVSSRPWFGVGYAWGTISKLRA